MRWTGDRVARALQSRGPADLVFESVATDSRTVQPGALFVALEGERFDGHRFLEAARERGARGAVVRHGTRHVKGLALYEVGDTVAALGRLARERRSEIRGPVLGLTGTNGKTSTKEMLRCALETRWRVHATLENQNNLIGVPLTILQAPDDCEALIVEAGANLPGEIARLRDVIGPSLGIVTNVGAGHLEGFGSAEGVMREKVSLLEGLDLAVVGTDPPELASHAAAVSDRVVSAGLAEHADLRPDGWGIHPTGHGWFIFRGTRVDLPLLGRHQIENALLATAVALELELDLVEVGSALARVVLPPGRCESISVGDRLVLKDTYNANPESLLALLDVARIVRGGRRLVVLLGTMLELGEESTVLHERMAEAVIVEKPDLVAVMGAFIPAFERHAAALGAALVTAPDSDSLGRVVAPLLDSGDIVLVKGSHGVHMERAIPHILARDRGD